MDPRTAPPIPRIEALDALRGFALGGIFFVNIVFMSGPGGFTEGAAPFLDQAFLQGKFYILFSFLFGYSLTMQFRSAERAGANGTLRTVRRCLMLAVIGLLHMMFLFHGDVLFGYAVIGLELLALSRLRPKTALIVAGSLFAVFVVVITAFLMLGTGAAQRDPAQALAAMRAGWLDAASYRWDGFLSGLPLFVPFGMLGILPLLLVGLAAGKVRLLEQPDRYLHLLPRVQWIGFGIGIPVCVLATAWPALTGPAYLAAPLLSAAYAATLLRLLHRYPAVGAVFAPAGKIAATNYIGQSLLTAILFTGYGFALAGRLGDWTVLGIAAAIYAGQLAFSAWYVRRHRYGPIEWALRAATYATVRPGRLRRAETPSAATG
ncbi:DUF418 domain-containing protein [Nocardia sp. NPDC052566]|uniref:DUF418 domain-containing protein n=1 Tax=Nocardia sp. NPDC052566 TaxID=3364330 RepID=UPI0037CB7B22